jgi:glycerate kinase
MRIVVAPDKFKDCLPAAQVCEAIARGLGDVPAAEVVRVPLADGGEGTVDALVAATGGRFQTRRVTGPLPEMKVDARFGILGDGQTAVIEMSAASGLHLLTPVDRNPMHTTTFGTGELIRHAAALGCKRIILGIGGSATCDGGIGCCQACGLPVLLEGGEPTSDTEPLCGRDLEKVVLIKTHRGGVEGVEIIVACDVTNPLYGPNGAARVFGPQKGASPEEIEQLDAWLRRLAIRCSATEAAETPGAGAAGGLGFAMLAFFNATLRPGAQIVMDAVQLRQKLRTADLCITGEGRVDVSTSSGKTVSGVARLCAEMGIPCDVICGRSDVAALPGVGRIVQLTDLAKGGEDPMRDAPLLLERAAHSLIASRR